MFKEELWKRQQTTADVTLLQRNQVAEETTLLEEIQQNGTKKQEVVQELAKQDSQSWEEDKIIYVDGKIYVPNNCKIRERILQENHNPIDVGHPGQ